MVNAQRVIMSVGSHGMTKEETLGNLEDVLKTMRYTAYASDELSKTDVGKIETLATQLNLLVEKMRDEQRRTG